MRSKLVKFLLHVPSLPLLRLLENFSALVSGFLRNLNQSLITWLTVYTFKTGKTEYTVFITGPRDTKFGAVKKKKKLPGGK